VERRPPKESRPVSSADAEMLRNAVLHRDEQVLVVNKPAGLAVQGGSGTHRHLDAMLDALRFEAKERPRLVHRLDKDTSGVLLLARTAKAASLLTAGFRLREARKLYWAVVAGNPHPEAGRIANRIGKKSGTWGDRMEEDDAEGKAAVTFFRTVDHAGRSAALLALEPRTGRTHQLRVHCALLGTPILGDGKYGGAAAFLDGYGIARGLHLHARSILMPHPSGGLLTVTAPVSAAMAETMRFLGFQPDRQADALFDDEE
jgi:23S rRNA pseudouridine955/2504/2580 synthase